jgi:hypothetical protein
VDSLTHLNRLKTGNRGLWRHIDEIQISIVDAFISSGWRILLIQKGGHTFSTTGFRCTRSNRSEETEVTNALGAANTLHENVTGCLLTASRSKGLPRTAPLATEMPCSWLRLSNSRMFRE